MVVVSGGGRIFVTGPTVVRAVTGEDIDVASLGGPRALGRRSGLDDLAAEEDAAALAAAVSVTAPRPPGPGDTLGGRLERRSRGGAAGPGQPGDPLVVLVDVPGYLPGLTQE